jgi:outer membrane protein OmpA-like peptidoglycan-associated protein
MKIITTTALSLSLSVVSAAALAQSPRTRAPIASSDVLSQISMFDYREGPKSDLEFKGTPLAPDAEGKATIEYENGNARIDVKVDDLPAPTELGPYTTYVLWALTPDGRAQNEGVLADSEGGKGKLETQYAAPQFALIVTAEPHFAVSIPSNMIVLYNVADKVKGKETKVTTLRERADYSSLRPMAIDKNRPVEVVAAEYSVEAAKAAGAEQFASQQYSTARNKLSAAETAAAATKRSERKDAPQLAREAVLAGEDARRAARTGREQAESAAAQAAAAARAAEVASAETAARERMAQRRQLLEKLNNELPTRETDRGLVSEIGGVQFATGTADLSPKARESLARFAGIVAAYPELKLKIEGHTDNTGSEQTNEELSLRRAITVRDYLVSQHVPASNIDAEGLASSHPIADNGTPEGRARNRRVEIGISGGPLDGGNTY